MKSEWVTALESLCLQYRIICDTTQEPKELSVPCHILTDIQLINLITWG